MSEEEVVRLWVAKTPTAELLKRIGSRPAGYALDPEMLEELRTAGLPRELIEAMVARQKAAAAESGISAPAESASDALAETQVRFVVPGKADDPIDISVAKSIDPGQLKAMGIRDPEAEVEDVAVYVACLNAPYVPDRWRSKSPLGRDFSAPRHRMLAFHSGADVEDKVVRLRVPEQLAFEMEQAPPWTVEVGIARRIGDRFIRLSWVKLDGYDPANGPSILVEITRGKSDPILRIRQSKALDAE